MPQVPAWSLQAIDEGGALETGRSHAEDLNSALDCSSRCSDRGADFSGLGLYMNGGAATSPDVQTMCNTLQSIGVPAASARQAARRHPDDLNAALDWACSSQRRRSAHQPRRAAETVLRVHLAMSKPVISTVLHQRRRRLPFRCLGLNLLCVAARLMRQLQPPC